MCGMGAGNHAKNNISHKWVFLCAFQTRGEVEGNWRRARPLPAGHLVLGPACSGSTCLLANAFGLKRRQPGKAVLPGRRHPLQANGSITLPHTQALKKKKKKKLQFEMSQGRVGQKNFGRAAGLAVRSHFFKFFFFFLFNGCHLVRLQFSIGV